MQHYREELLPLIFKSLEDGYVSPDEVLRIACSQGNWKVARIALSKNANPNSLHKINSLLSRHSPLKTALNADNIDFFKPLINEFEGILDDNFLSTLTEELTLFPNCNESLIHLCSFIIKKHDFDEENRAMLLKKLLVLGKLSIIKELAENKHLESVLTSDFINDYFENDLYALPLESMKYLFSFLEKE